MWQLDWWVSVGWSCRLSESFTTWLAILTRVTRLTKYLNSLIGPARPPRRTKLTSLTRLTSLTKYLDRQIGPAMPP